jgi:hypothetical protein
MTAIADSPTDEVWMSLIAERLFSAFHNAAKGRWMRSVSEGVENRNAFMSRDVKLARSSCSNVGSDNESNFLTKWLNIDCKALLA